MENSLPCRKRPWPRSTLRDELQKRGCAYGPRAWPAMTSRAMPFQKQLKVHGLWARTGNERDHCIAYFWGSLVDGPASRAKRRWRCKTRSSARIMRRRMAVEGPRAPCAAQFAHGKMHVFSGVLPRCLALGDPAVGGFLFCVSLEVGDIG